MTTAGQAGTSRTQQAQRTRERLLQAAIRVIQRDGTANLTLAKVATEAEITKGGLLHHFASKDALIVSLLDRTLQAADDELERRADKYANEDGAFAKAYLEYVRDPYTEATDTGSSIVAAAAMDDRMLAGARATFETWQGRLLNDDGLTEVTALLARIVGDGLWLIDLFGLAPPTWEQRSEVVDFLLARIEAEVAEPDRK